MFHKNNLIKIINEPGKEFDVTSLHGKYATFTMRGQDIGFAQVGIISSGKDYILFQFRDKMGLIAKTYVKYVQEVHMTERKLKKEQELVVKEWDEDINPFLYFVGKRCNIHVHQTRLFEASPGFFGCRIEYVGENIVRIKESSRDYNVNQYMICALMES